ncbi:MAG: maturase, partial [Actinobacteria bacterium]|nr:maturase [Actinomycetota bacterium]
RWVMETSMLRTLAAKHNSTVPKMAKKHKAKIDTPEGIRTCFEARVERPGRQPLIARFGGIPLKRKKLAVITDRQPSGAPYPHRELITRFRHGRCELCTSTDDIHVHHLARLTDLAGPGPHPEWTRFMAKRRRKTIVVCRSCYDTIHSGTPRTITQ